MSGNVRVAVLFGFGINCDRETAAVFDMVGGTSERLHVNNLVQGNRSLEEFDILAVPGGFSFGDHLGSGRLLGNRLRFALREQLQKFVSSGKPIIGICNGFQALVKTGLLPGPENASLEPDLIQRASLTLNNTGRYEDRWVTLEFDSQSPCIWTKGIQRIECPVRHGEGRFVMPTNSELDRLSSNHQLTVRYVDPSTEPGAGLSDDLLPFPLSPNGSMRNIAGICDPTGLVFGLMPHPEAFYTMWLHPEHTSMKLNEDEWEGAGLQIFRNAVEYVRSQR
ncbi:MAG: phosphoribosylformylglycinamidine synthase subunit PurQ [Euryarchaeota archaeon]|jgi:phosphoribosylformylglycinamidine synthase I|nr:phosphoribosylformylglycinamidine synthase subunit PurQ [Euryarchaeota archaeon]